MTRRPQAHDPDETKAAALAVLLHNSARGRGGLPRTAGFGYPEPYTRDLMIASLPLFAARHPTLTESLGRVLTALARHQSARGHIPSLADEPDDRGESDTTPLFLIGLAVYRQVAKRPRFLEAAAKRALVWLQYQSPADRVIVAQQPTSDWRDEQWVMGYGLYVNTLVYAALRLFDRSEEAQRLRRELNRPIITRGWMRPREHEGLSITKEPYYAMWSYKVLNNHRFDLLGNSLAILTGVASRRKAETMIAWVEKQCGLMREEGLLAVDLPPCLFPFIGSDAPDWLERYRDFNLPGEYHNGGIWPFVAGFYIAALVAAGKRRLAAQKRAALADLVARSVRPDAAPGFNEWLRAQDGRPRGVDWQTWSAAMYLYAADCVETNRTPLFDAIRGDAW